jgi:hypothetical protein
MEEPISPTNTEKICTEIIEAFCKRYSPAADMTEAGIFLTTTEIYNEVISHYPNPEITETMVYELLIDSDFKYDVLHGSSKFVWLLKSK